MLTLFLALSLAVVADNPQPTSLVAAFGGSKIKSEPPPSPQLLEAQRRADAAEAALTALRGELAAVKSELATVKSDLATAQKTTTSDKPQTINVSLGPPYNGVFKATKNARGFWDVQVGDKIIECEEIR